MILELFLHFSRGVEQKAQVPFLLIIIVLKTIIRGLPQQLNQIGIIIVFSNLIHLNVLLNEECFGCPFAFKVRYLIEGVIEAKSLINHVFDLGK